MSFYIPYGKQNINQEDIDAVVDVLQSDWLTQGPTIKRFEQTVANYCGAKYAVAVSSATAGLHIACLAAGLGIGDYFWTSPITFVASANCGLYCGATVDFVDINSKTYNLSVDELEKKLFQAKKENNLPKLVIPVHLSGQSCEMNRIHQLSQQYGFQVLEDASHAIGGEYKRKPIGCCEFSDMAVFSFHPVKIITTGEGGIVITNRQDLYQKLIRLRSHGITRAPDLMTDSSHGPWYYQQLELGFNYRITDIQAALGVSQMKRLDEFVEKRRSLAGRYNQILKDLPIQLPEQQADTNSSWHLYIIRLYLEKISKTHRQIFEELRSLNIGINLHYIPIYYQPFYQQFNFKKKQFLQSESYYQEAISLPLYFDLQESSQDYVCEQLSKVLLN
ncbi:UDP-4-keto-6-deoxy-N-acetylglucosamine4-aminotra nsferase [[Leptolyngbya] sp. PCC 7376]|uniref:UDP-4-amino-4, 6-dideoxy-N-acetyl-beta-L-altrosamine transaminase n=1 Tax=[Leptolyngbya] sp. PCC 7376 TaxID=111781 RepID=UPI00029F2251|nr:UDP-4-amino-4,6-dideoxy-N-acetyl-beta-L-altrosamine transaminase [[Leptolyngbya] sp. PCC 7376]AFY36533.1 UDP-4-keto-6-deoxy-N-acetylglucosamine4-aminotra nsferase [[Leptolyngbya] sp. PCC 7376]